MINSTDRSSETASFRRLAKVRLNAMTVELMNMERRASQLDERLAKDELSKIISAMNVLQKILD